MWESKGCDGKTCADFDAFVKQVVKKKNPLTGLAMMAAAKVFKITFVFLRASERPLVYNKGQDHVCMAWLSKDVKETPRDETPLWHASYLAGKPKTKQLDDLLQGAIEDMCSGIRVGGFKSSASVDTSAKESRAQKVRLKELEDKFNRNMEKRNCKESSPQAEDAPATESSGCPTNESKV